MDIMQKTLKALEFDKVKEELSKCAKFEQSKKLCLSLCPVDNEDIIKKQLKYTAEAKKILDCAKETPCEFIADMQKIKSNAGISYLEEDELIDVAKTMRSSRLLKRFIAENTDQDSMLGTAASNLFSDRETEDKIFDVFDDNFRIKQNATPELKGLYSSLKDTQQNLRDTVNALLNNSSFSKYLQNNIYTERDDRIVFQVIASNKTKIPGIIHDVSSSSKTFYI